MILNDGPWQSILVNYWGLETPIIGEKGKRDIHEEPNNLRPVLL